ncbi:hypothetical protein HGO37_19655 [Rhizobium sp. CG4]|jgi:hypothetical protein|uniref:hypothetical protein n=1 Tax=Rhizobium sp. CG4 TaxID=2726075 RepID=UPI0020345860|nr:hypothetical protein [Rhizobium sp. CG4]MCM2457614.1 hypothetical protein [Rhizobium sp. CG4]
MTAQWRDELRLKLEDLVDRFVTDGVDQKEVLKAVSEEIGNLHKAYQQDPDPADDDSLVDEPANDWPAAT